MADLLPNASHHQLASAHHTTHVRTSHMHGRHHTSDTYPRPIGYIQNRSATTCARARHTFMAQPMRLHAAAPAVSRRPAAPHGAGRMGSTPETRPRSPMKDKPAASLPSNRPDPGSMILQTSSGLEKYSCGGAQAGASPTYLRKQGDSHPATQGAAGSAHPCRSGHLVTRESWHPHGEIR